MNNNEFDPKNLPADASYLTGPEPEFNPDAYRQDSGGLITTNNGVADILLKNDRLYNAMKGDWTRTSTNGSGNMKITTGRRDGKFYITREQHNVREVAARCARYRAASEAGAPDALAPLMPDGKLGYKWMDLPDVIAIRISDEYFGGIPWAVLIRDRTMRAQFYRVVQEEYPAFICYPGGRLPIPIEVPYPNRVGQQKYFKGI
jgi:hypothetical protein